MSVAGKLLGIGVTLATTLFAQDVPTFRTGVFLVHMDVEILGQNGRPLTGLSKDDFRVLDGGAEQDIVAFSEGEQPLDLILLFDISSSMRRQVKKIAAVSGESLRQLRRGDRVCVMVFDREARVVAPFSDNLDAVEQAINSVLGLRFVGGTWIQDSVGEAARNFSSSDDRERRRRVMLVVTDDLGRPARHKKRIIEDLLEEDVLVAGLVVRNRAALAGLLAPLGSTRPGGVEDLAEQTGGDLIRSDDLSASFPEIMHRLRSRYTLYYKAPDGRVGSLRKMDVQLSARACNRFPGAHVLARHAYRLHDRDQYGFVSR